MKVIRNTGRQVLEKDMVRRFFLTLTVFLPKYLMGKIDFPESFEILKMGGVEPGGNQSMNSIRGADKDERFYLPG
jgi:hypothetical protein